MTRVKRKGAESSIVEQTTRLSLMSLYIFCPSQDSSFDLVLRFHRCSEVIGRRISLLLVVNVGPNILST